MRIYKINELKLCSFLTAFYLSLFYINGVVGIHGIAYITILCIMGICCLAVKKGWIKVYREWILILIFFVFMYGVSFFRLGINQYTVDYFMHFLTFGVIGIIIGMQRIQIMYVAKYMLYVGYIGIPVIIYRYSGLQDDSEPVVMGLVYAMLPILVIYIL